MQQAAQAATFASAGERIAQGRRLVGNIVRKIPQDNEVAHLDHVDAGDNGWTQVPEELIAISPPLTYHIIMMRIPHVIASTESFLDSASEIWSESEIQAFEVYIGLNPEAGKIIPGCGGIRKVRWAVQGKGKRGGARVIYYYHDDAVPIYLLYAYPKSEREDLTDDEKKILRHLVEELKKCFRAKKRR